MQAFEKSRLTVVEFCEHVKISASVFAEQAPYSGSLFVFVSRRGNYVKILVWDRRLPRGVVAPYVTRGG